MAITSISLLNTFLEQMNKINELVTWINGAEAGTSNVANDSITGTIFTISSGNEGISVSDSTITIGESLEINVGTLATSTDDVAADNIASAQIVNTAYELTRTAFTQANTGVTDAATASSEAGGAHGTANSASTTAGAAYDQANTATTSASDASGTGGAAFDKANTASLEAGGAHGTANTATTSASDALASSGAAFDKANTTADTETAGIVEFATSAEFRNNTQSKVLEVSNVWSSAVNVDLTMAATIAIDLNLGYNFTLNLSSSGTLGAPTNTRIGMTGVIEIRSSNSSAVLSYTSPGWVFPDDNPPSNSANTSAADYLFYEIMPTGAAYGSLSTNVPYA